MFTKEVKKELTIAFWDKVKNALNKHKSSHGGRINWLNYPTGVKGIRINLFADNNLASVNLDLEHQDLGIRELHLEQLRECQKVLEKEFDVPLIWHEIFTRENGKIITRIQPEPLKANLFKEEDHQSIIEHFKIHMHAFDRFWNNFGAIFDDLQ